jgi:hypothetical protein
MSTACVTPDRVLIVDRRLLPKDGGVFEFVELLHPRTQQAQSFAFDRTSNSVFEMLRSTRPHSSWFTDDGHVLADGSVYVCTPVHVLFLLLPSLWSQARDTFVPWTWINTLSLLDDASVRTNVTMVCDVQTQDDTIRLNDEKLFRWLADRLARLKKHMIDDEDAFDLLCEYLPDAVAERCRQEWHLTVPPSQPGPSIDQKALTKTVVTNKNKRSKK